MELMLHYLNAAGAEATVTASKPGPPATTADGVHMSTECWAPIKADRSDGVFQSSIGEVIRLSWGHDDGRPVSDIGIGYKHGY